MVRDDPRRPLPLARPRRDLGAHPPAMGRPEAPAMDRAAAPNGRRSIRSASIRATARSCGSAYPAAACGRRATAGNLGLPRRRHVRRLPAARDGPRSKRAGPALPGPEPERARPPLGAASQRRLPQRRRIGELARDRRRSARPHSASPLPSIRASRTLPGSCRRSRTSAASRSTASWSSPARATRGRTFDVLREGPAAGTCL